jgi:potassium voltage-gated channel Eag-related subfamily H protein 5
MIVIPFILSSYSVPYAEYVLLLRVTKVKTMIEAIEEVTNPSVTV